MIFFSILQFANINRKWVAWLLLNAFKIRTCVACICLVCKYPWLVIWKCMLYMYFDLDVQIQGPLYHLWCVIEFSGVSVIKKLALCNINSYSIIRLYDIYKWIKGKLLGSCSCQWKRVHGYVWCMSIDLVCRAYSNSKTNLVSTARKWLRWWQCPMFKNILTSHSW